jgi:hypothetical protein
MTARRTKPQSRCGGSCPGSDVRILLQHALARTYVGTKETLATIRLQCGFGFDVAATDLPQCWQER